MRHHVRMALRLDPRIPVVWRTPDSIQLGVDRPLTVVSGLTPALERVLGALGGGVPLSGALMLGRSAGASEPEITRLLDALRPALLGDEWTTPRPAGRVWMDGSGPTADRIGGLLGDLGIRVLPQGADRDAALRAADASDGEPELAILVAHYVIEPARHGRWLRRDIPHLPVIFSDTGVRHGPLVEPGAGPCLTCVDLASVDADPAWPALAVQLLGRRAPTETPLVSAEVAIRVARLVETRLRTGMPGTAGESYSSDAETGEVTRRVHQPHERCGCRSLTGSGTAPVAPAAAPRRKTSSATAGAVPA